jgi:hypothetical protein
LGQPDSIDGVISESKYLLDDSNAAKEQADAVKRQLKELLRPGNDLPELMLAQMNWPEGLPQPHVILQEISTIMSRLQTLMHLNWSTKVVDQLQRRWCCFESPSLFKERWEKMFRNFCHVGSGDESDGSTTQQQQQQPYSEKYADPSWIPELYDSLKYDALHNRPFLNAIFTDPDLVNSTAPSPDLSLLSQSPPAASTLSTSPLSASSPLSQHTLAMTNRRLSMTTEPTMRSCNRDLRKLYKYVKIMFDFIAPQEFGISDMEKKNIGMLISLPLLKSILMDLDDMTTSETPKTRLYFTKGKDR